VQDAILRRAGLYGAFVALAEACESDNVRSPRACRKALVPERRTQVNAAQLMALVWSLDAPAASGP
jgi:hypothetical protein